MTVGVILEEPSADPVVRRIADWLRISIKTIIARGAGNLKNKLIAYANELSGDCTKVLALVDSHCSDPLVVEEDYRNASTSSATDVHICVVVHALESWLLADSQAVGRRLRAPRLRTPASPETLCKPEQELDKLFQQHGKRYLKNRDAEKIIDLARPKTIRRKCPSFANFEDSLRDC